MFRPEMMTLKCVAAPMPVRQARRGPKGPTATGLSRSGVSRYHLQ